MTSDNASTLAYLVGVREKANYIGGKLTEDSESEGDASLTFDTLMILYLCPGYFSDWIAV